MKTIKYFFIIITYLNIIITSPIYITNLEEIELSKGKSEYFFKFPIIKPEKDKTSYFFFKFLEDKKIKISIFFDNLKDDIFVIEPINKNKWINFPIINKEKVSNATFIVLNENKNTKMYFLANIGEINIKLEELFNMDLDIFNLKYSPFPLIFNIKNLENNILFTLEEKNDEKIYNNKYVLNYCIENNNKNCDYFLGNDEFNLRKEKNYKFALNAYFIMDSYYFKSIKLFTYIKELDFKNNTLSTYNFVDNVFYILDIKSYSDIFFIIKDNVFYYHKDYFISFTNKSSLINDIYKIIQKKSNNSLQEKYTGNIYHLNISNNSIKSDYLIIGYNKNNKYINNKEYKYEAFILFFNAEYKLNNDNNDKIKFKFNIKKGIQALINITIPYNDISILTSNNKNLKLFYRNNFNEFSKSIILKECKGGIVYVDCSENDTIINYNIFEYRKYPTLFFDDDINYNFQLFETDSLFNRINPINLEEEINGFNDTFFIDINEKYFIYNKIFFGNINILKYNNELILYNNDSKFIDDAYRIYSPGYDKISNNELKIVSGLEKINFAKNMDSSYDFFIQKIDDSNIINLNSKIFKYNNNLVKLLTADKKYILNFELNHLIKLDNNFLDAKIIFKNELGKEYILDNKNKIIENLTGKNINIISNKNALIYFYEKINSNFSQFSPIEFDKTKKGKYMKLIITNKKLIDETILISKDFCFKEYYPMINSKNLQKIVIKSKSTKTVYIENYYDKLEFNNLYEKEGEKFYIYLFELNKNNKLTLLDKNNFDISFPIYINYFFDEYNFEVIPPNKNTFLLKVINKPEINYKILKCNSTQEINFDIENENEEFNEKNIGHKYINKINNPYKYIKIGLKPYNILIYNFESKNEFLFYYNFYSHEYQYPFLRNADFKIKSIIKIKNNIKVSFTPSTLQDYSSNELYCIIVAKKDEIYNLDSFSNPCFVSKLIKNNSNKICLIKFHGQGWLINQSIDINKIISGHQDENTKDTFIITVINLSHLEFYKPVEFNEEYENEQIIDINIGEKVNFNPLNRYYFKFKYNHKGENSYLDFKFFDEYSPEKCIFLIQKNKKS